MGEIYQITNNINGKIYIGKTKRTSYLRWLEHIRDSKNYPDLNIPLHKAIIKYGIENFTMNILEQDVSEIDLNSVEKYYIKLFNSNNSSIGYNATVGGDGGTTSLKLNERQVKEIQKYLLDEDNIDSFAKIGKKYNVGASSISSINKGLSWKDELLSYPLRKFNTSQIRVCKSTYKKIVKDLINGEKSNESIAHDNNVDISTVNSINLGKFCYNNNNDYYRGLYNGDYPIKPYKKIPKLECDFNKAFYLVLFTNKSISQIEKEMNIHFANLRYIVLGKRRKEITEKYKTPMRDVKNIDYNKNVWLSLNKDCKGEIK